MTVMLTDVRTVPRVTREERLPAISAATPSPTQQLVDETGVPDIVDVWGLDSFPASDAPANW